MPNLSAVRRPILPLIPAVATSHAAACPRGDQTSSVRPQRRQTRTTHSPPWCVS